MLVYFSMCIYFQSTDFESRTERVTKNDTVVLNLIVLADDMKSQVDMVFFVNMTGIPD